jgi:hypothetical protein
LTSDTNAQDLPPKRKRGRSNQTPIITGTAEGRITPMTQQPRDRAIGLTLFAVGLLAFVSSMLGKGTVWVWLLSAAGLCLLAHRSGNKARLLANPQSNAHPDPLTPQAWNRNALWVVPGGLLGGLALSFLFNALFPWSRALPLGLAGGFALMAGLEPRVHAWALWPAVICVLAWAFVALWTNVPLMILLLVGFGTFFWLRSRPE